MKEKKKANVGYKKILIIAVLFIVVAGVAIVFVIFSANNKNYTDKYNLISTEWYNETAEEQPEFIKKFNEVSSFKFIDCMEKEDGYYEITVSVSSPDISESLVNLSNKLDSSNEKLTTEQLNKELNNLINESTNIKTTEQMIYIIRDDNGNENVKFSEGFVDAMYGYAFSTGFAALQEN